MRPQRRAPACTREAMANARAACLQVLDYNEGEQGHEQLDAEAMEAEQAAEADGGADEQQQQQQGDGDAPQVCGSDEWAGMLHARPAASTCGRGGSDSTD